MRHTIVLLLAFCMLLLSGCDPGSGSDTQDPTPTPTPTPLPEFTECTSEVPVDPGNLSQPVITLLGDRVVNQPLDRPYTDAGARATDPRDGDITSRIVVTGRAAVDTATVGDYLIRYNVTNAAQLRAVEAVRIVRVNGGTFKAQTARDIGSTSAHMGYFEHLPVNYSDDPSQRFPLIIYQHGWTGARFLDAYTVQAPLSYLAGSHGNLVGIINDGHWDDSRPFIVLSPQRCVDPLTYGVTARYTKLFIDYALNTYKVDPTRIYMSGHSMGSIDTWDYVTNYPHQLAAVFPISGGYGVSSGCLLRYTPAWAFIGETDTVIPYQAQVDTVNSINACGPVERAKVSVLPGLDHLAIEYPVLGLTGLGQGLPAYDLYGQNIYDWLLQHRLPGGNAVPHEPEPAAVDVRGEVAAPELVLSLAPPQIAIGGSVRLKWSAKGAGSCVASGDWQGTRPARGTETVTPVAPGAYGYVLSCTGPLGTVAQSVSLEVSTPR